METADASQTNQSFIQQELPNSTAILVLGIASIVSCWCLGIPGLVCGIIAMVLASKSEILYRNNTNLYRPGSYANLKAGKVCAIIGICLSGLMFLSFVTKLIIGAAFLGFFTSILPFLNN